jgi:RNA polymerase sigma-70 factor (ECF subfamily)
MRKVRARPTISTERQSDSGEEQPPFEGIDENTPAQDAERAELKTKIDEALERLSPDHRAVILLKEVEGLKYNEIAEAIGCSIGTVMSRLFHARRNLQKYLSDEKD